jgi:hypothetical protein
VLALALFSFASWQTANTDLQALRARWRALPSVGFRPVAACLSEAMNSCRSTQQTDAPQSNSNQTDIRTLPVSAHWRTTPQRDPEGLPKKNDEVGERTELSRYTISSGERVLYGQRIKGCVRLTDRPASGPGRSYLVERELENDGYEALKALVADYTRQAHASDEIPMVSSVIRRELQEH